MANLGKPPPTQWTLWFNTGTLCNIECVHCYIESSPRNDRLEYITRAEVAAYLDEIAALDLPTREIGFTGGEPFLNPELAGMMEDALLRGFEVLVLTNAMQPMMRLPVREALLRLRETYGDRITLRISIDHYTREYHDAERGPDSFDTTLRGVRWLVAHAFHLSVAGRTRWDEEEVSARDGYRRLFTAEEMPVDANDPSELVVPGDGCHRRCSGDHQRLLESSRRRPKRHDVRDVPDGGETQRRRDPRRDRLYASAVRAAVRARRRP